MKALLFSLAIGCTLLGDVIADAQVIHSSSGTSNSSNVIDGNGSSYGQASDATACPTGWTVSSGKCTLGSHSIEGWVIVDFEGVHCRLVDILHKSNCNPINCTGSQKFYVFASGDPTTPTSWFEVGNATSSSTLVTTTFAPAHLFRFLLLGTDDDLSRPDSRWYEAELGGIYSFCE